MKDRFEGENGRRILIEALLSQKLVSGNRELASSIADVAILLDIETGHELIRQHAEDNDVYLILSGCFDVFVNKSPVAKRFPNEHIGEMVVVQPTQRRSATVSASQPSVVCKISEPQFNELSEKFPSMWKEIGKELARRLEQRNNLITQPRDKVRIFVMSSVEALDIARGIQAGFSYDAFTTIVWENGVFLASKYPLESLEEELDKCDFGIAIAQADDFITIRDEKTPTLRDNVVFELGFFMGRLGRQRTFLLEPRGTGVKLPSDLKGINTISYNSDKSEDLAIRLGPTCTEIRKIVQKLGPVR